MPPWPAPNPQRNSPTIPTHSTHTSMAMAMEAAGLPTTLAALYDVGDVLDGLGTLYVPPPDLPCVLAVRTPSSHGMA